MTLFLRFIVTLLLLSALIPQRATAQERLYTFEAGTVIFACEDKNFLKENLNPSGSVNLFDMRRRLAFECLTIQYGDIVALPDESPADGIMRILAKGKSLWVDARAKSHLTRIK